MSRQDDIRAAEQAVIEAARAVDADADNSSRALHLALCSLDSLLQPPTALDVVERVRKAVTRTSEMSTGSGTQTREITEEWYFGPGLRDLLNQIEREIKESKP